LPNHRLERQLGSGTYAEVWKAIAPDGYPVALKFVRLIGEDAKDPGGLEEAAHKVIRSIPGHANVLTIFEAVTRDNYLIIKMELADCTLFDRLKASTAQGLAGIPPGDLLQYMRDAARGIDHINDRNIVHRDIKPHNIMVMGDSAKVADFGLAKMVERTIARVSLRLTPAYTAPEFLDERATRWSDQYCLAVTYCQLRANRLPFEGSYAKVIRGHRHERPNLTMLPETERPIVARALAKNPEERWPDCRTFVEELTKAIARHPDGERSLPIAAPPRPVIKPSQLEPAEASSADVGSLSSSAESAIPKSENKPIISPPPPHGPVEMNVPEVLSGSDVTVSSISALPQADAGEVVSEDDVITWLSDERPPQRDDDRDRRRLKWSRRLLTGIALILCLALGVAFLVKKLSPAAVLRLEPVQSLQVVAGKTAVLDIEIKRDNCAGPVEIQVEGLPEKLTAPRIMIPADEKSGRLEFRAAEDAAAATGTGRLLARLATAQALQQLPFTIRAPQLHIDAIDAVTIYVTKTRMVDVHVKRQDCEGPVHVSLPDLPEGVQAKPIVLAAGQDHGGLELTANATAVLGTRPVGLTVSGDNVVCAIVFPLTVTIDREAQKRAVQALEKLGGRIRRDDSSAEKPVTELDLSGSAATDADLLSFASLPCSRKVSLSRCGTITGSGLEHLRDLNRLEVLSLESTAVTDAGLKKLAGFTNLRELSLADCERISDAGLQCLGNLRQLQNLNLTHTQITDAALAAVATLSDLRQLSLMHCIHISDAGLAQLRTLKQLQKLDLSLTGVSDSGLEHIKELPQLKELVLTATDVKGLQHVSQLRNLQILNLHDTKITDTCLQDLKNLSRLRSLDLSQTKVTDEGLATVAAHSELRDLYLWDCEKIGDPGVQHLKDLQHLQVLHLEGTGVTDVGLQHLKNLRQLEKLLLGHTAVSDAALANFAAYSDLRELSLAHCKKVGDAGLEHLKNLRNLRVLRLDATAVTDAGLKHLKDLTQLEELDLSRSKVTEDGVRKLSASLPNTRVSFIP
jgi:serine/threonine protein kinase/Leucine-rich repeat (LRR) protein